MSNALCVVFHVNTVDTRDQRKSCFIGSNTMLCYVDTVDTVVFVAFTQMHTDIFVHNFVNIQQIFNPEKVLKS